jgi:hypothetical protein
MVFGSVLDCEEGGPDGGSKLWSRIGFIDSVLRRDVVTTYLNDKDARVVGHAEDRAAGGSPREDVN